jgi:hypothetical protein
MHEPGASSALNIDVYRFGSFALSDPTLAATAVIGLKTTNEDVDLNLAIIISTCSSWSAMVG